QRGAFEILLVGQVRSGNSTLICSWNGVYRPNGIFEGVCLFSNFSPLLGLWGLAAKKLRDESGPIRPRRGH
ncbi:MAG: hypothetical protein RLZZ579_1239, partial [Actinomycetota bacterium]